MGRKVTDLSPPAADMVAGLPGECSKQLGLPLTRMFYELLLRDREDGRATGQPQGFGPEAYLHGTS